MHWDQRDLGVHPVRLEAPVLEETSDEEGLWDFAMCHAAAPRRQKVNTTIPPISGFKPLTERTSYGQCYSERETERCSTWDWLDLCNPSRQRPRKMKVVEDSGVHLKTVFPQERENSKIIFSGVASRENTLATRENTFSSIKSADEKTCRNCRNCSPNICGDEDFL